jgi:hypothetical protein
VPEAEFDRLGQLLIRIFHISMLQWKRNRTLEGEKVDNATADDYQKLLVSKPPIAEGELKNLLRKPKRKRLLLDRPFYLPPLKYDREFIPVLQMDWKSIEDGSDISIRIEMHRYVQEYPGGSRSYLRSLGFRFEIHRGKAHDYMHVQVTKPGVPEWLPTSLPCIPTIAKCPVSLLFCVLASLYGKNMYNMFFADINTPNECLNPLKEILTTPRRQFHEERRSRL